MVRTGPKGQKRPADSVANAIKVARIAPGEEEEEFIEGPPRAEERGGGGARS